MFRIIPSKRSFGIVLSIIGLYFMPQNKEFDKEIVLCVYYLNPAIKNM